MTKKILAGLFATFGLVMALTHIQDLHKVKGPVFMPMAHADQLPINNAPFWPEETNVYNALAGQSVPVVVKNVARVVWDCDGNSNQCSGTTVTTTQLPRNALVLKSYFYVQTAVSGFDTTTLLSLGCGNIDFLGATQAKVGVNPQPFSIPNILVSGAQQEGMSTLTGYSTSNIYAVTNQRCSLTWKIAGTAPTRGKVVGFIEYNITQ